MQSARVWALGAMILAGAVGCGHTPASDDADTDIGEAPGARDGWWRDRVFYEIFVRSFYDSDGDGVGDFVGLTEKLDVLNDGDPTTTSDLGVTGIWLMPINASPSYHGYDVTDYRSVNPDYGTMAEFEAFLAAAHDRGIRVIMDFVMNHSSVRHPWFVSARRGPDSEFRDYYTWRPEDPGWRQPWGTGPVWHPTASGYYYGIFWSGMPDLNLANPAVETEMVEAMEFWLERGIDGFRVDAARHFFESDDGQLSDQPEAHPFVKRLRRRLAAEHPDALLVAEVWTHRGTVAEYYGERGEEFQLAFGFDTASGIITSVRDGRRATFDQQMREIVDSYDDINFEAPFLTNHDMPRVMRKLGADPGAMRVAAATLFAVPGTPFVYYGEEIGMRGGDLPKDEDKRTPMPWAAEGATRGFSSAASWYPGAEAVGVDVESQRGVPDSLWTLYRDLIAMRQRHPALSDGELVTVRRDGGTSGVTAILRAKDDERILYVVNFSGTEESSAVRFEVSGAPTVLLGEGLTSPPVQQGTDLMLEGLAPRGYAYIRID